MVKKTRNPNPQPSSTLLDTPLSWFHRLRDKVRIKEAAKALAEEDPTLGEEPQGSTDTPAQPNSIGSITTSDNSDGFTTRVGSGADAKEGKNK